MTFEFLREQIVGVDSTFTTPFGERLMVYCDYTASGRCLLFVENYLQSLQRTYANTHTEDDTTGRNMTQLLHEAESSIKSAVNAGPDGRIIAIGTGATGAINKLQQILGVYCPPATRARILGELEACAGAEARAAYEAHLKQRQPVVFVGPFEHHSNEVSWREGLATVVEVRLDADGGIDLAHLEELLHLPQYQTRVRIGSFSAASNVTGMRTPVHAIARLLHRHGAIACFDYAASAPYEPIDMNPPMSPDGDASIDAVFISPHKYLGGPGSSGILVFNKRLYQEQLAPTIAAGGTVDYVSANDQDFIADIEEREKAGTPGTLQVLKAALALQVKDWIGSARIEAREHALLAARDAALAARAGHRNSRQPGPATTHRDRVVQSARKRRVRAAPSARRRALPASEIRHRVAERSVRHSIARRMFVRGSVRPPAARRSISRAPTATGPGSKRATAASSPAGAAIGFHYAMDDAEADYIIDAVAFIGEYGARFIGLYRFELESGTWTHAESHAEYEHLAFATALNAARVEPTARTAAQRTLLYRHFLDDARRCAETLARDSRINDARLDGELGELQFFALSERSLAR